MIPGLLLHQYIVGGVVIHLMALHVHYLVITIIMFSEYVVFFVHQNALPPIILMIYTLDMIFGKDILCLTFCIEKYTMIII